MEAWLLLAFGYAVVEFIDKTSNSGARFSSMEHRKQEAELERVRKAFGFTGGNASDFMFRHRIAAARVNAWTQNHGNTFQVRLKTDYRIEMRDNAMLSERDFRVLIGLYSMIGPKSFAKVGWPMIQARAAGHMRPEDPSKYVGPVYSRGQIERACTELLDRKFIASVTYNRGERFWSHRMSQEELAEAVTTKKTIMIQARRARAELNAKTSAAISHASLP